MTKDQVLTELKAMLFDSVISTKTPDDNQMKRIRELLKSVPENERMLEAFDDLDRLRTKVLSAWSAIYDVNLVTKDDLND